MPLSAGVTLGPYEILAPAGAGGMGEVYKARDPRLDRTVALKVSKAEFTERFTREARLVAQLNHANICTLYDVGPNYLVMEFVEGVPLKGPLPVEKAVEYAGQILDALDAAHRKGITHRDLKPANILVTKQGIKLLDFGLAKQKAAALGPDDVTVQSAITAEGQISGTLQYMAPEQLQGKDADARSDIFSFGCVLYETLSGSRAFGGTNAASVIAAILEREPEPLKTTPPLDRVIRTCLAKDPDQRFQNARDLKRDLLWAMDGELSAAAPSQSRFGKAGWIAAAVLAVLLVVISFVHFRERPPEMPLVRSTIPPPENSSFGFGVGPIGPPALSPDGRRLVFGALSEDGTSRLWLRSLDSVTAQPLAGTEGASPSYPFWSPDGRWIGFGAGGKLKKIDISGGPAVALADAPSLRGGSWNAQGVIIFAPGGQTPLLSVPAAGGIVTPVTALDPSRKESTHRWPWFLPDGRHFIFINGGTGHAIYVGSLDSRDKRILVQTDFDSNVAYASGHLVFLRDSTLMAQPFEPKSLATTGEAAPLAENVAEQPGRGRGFFAVSDTGTLVFQPGLPTGQVLAWLDRTGSRLSVVGEPGQFRGTSLSPDGKRAAVMVYERAARHYGLWIYDLARNLRSRITFDSGAEQEGVWSPDGSLIIFDSNRNGHYNLYRKLVSGAGVEELLRADGSSGTPTSWSPDGRFVMYGSGDRKTGNDLWVLPLDGERKPFSFLRTAFNEGLGQFSPDGHWVAYTSDESGRNEIYVTPFPGAGGKRQASLAGGSYPRWRRDGKELFYIGLDGRLMAAEVAIKGSAVEIGAVRPLFGLLLTGNGYQYDVSADGQHFLAIMPNEQATPEPLTLVQNWTASLKK